MFSGIVQGVGSIVTQTMLGADQRLTIALGGAAIAPPAIGGSIAVNGACLTAIAVAEDRFSADVSVETLAVTTFGRLGPGARVNVELPVRAGDPLDGHLVTGHVDGVGHVLELRPAGRSLSLAIELPPALARYVAAKGSIAVDGVSLTVNAVRGTRFEVNVIPHTQHVTVIGEYRRGTAVNIEVDMIARYLERLFEPAERTGVALSFLETHGYARND